MAYTRIGKGLEREVTMTGEAMTFQDGDPIQCNELADEYTKVPKPTS